MEHAQKLPPRTPRRISAVEHSISCNKFRLRRACHLIVKKSSPFPFNEELCCRFEANAQPGALGLIPLLRYPFCQPGVSNAQLSLNPCFWALDAAVSNSRFLTQRTF